MHACNRSRSASMMGCKILIRAYIPRWPVKHALMLQTMNPAIQAMHSLHGSEARSTARPTSLRQSVRRLFLFYIKKIQKYMSVLKNFENGPRSPGPGATQVLSPEQALNVIFF